MSVDSSLWHRNDYGLGHKRMHEISPGRGLSISSGRQLTCCPGQVECLHERGQSIRGAIVFLGLLVLGISHLLGLGEGAHLSGETT